MQPSGSLGTLSIRDKVSEAGELVLVELEMMVPSVNEDSDRDVIFQRTHLLLFDY